mgnify:CR=1 FL=1
MFWAVLGVWIFSFGLAALLEMPKLGPVLLGAGFFILYFARKPK